MNSQRYGKLLMKIVIPSWGPEILFLSDKTTDFKSEIPYKEIVPDAERNLIINFLNLQKFNKNLYKYTFGLIGMSYKLINASEARPGVAIMVDQTPCIVRSNDMSKTGKHGHTKCRIEAISAIDGKKKVFAVSGHERLECPMIIRNKAQVLSVAQDKANVMDLESFESFEIPIPEELKAEIKDQDQVEYWVVEGSKIIKRKL